eukprot:GHUV01019139.1.p1 GENE.GHUV01019139.1~~GHUV01019139.1.p1  ORF type:complete len:212 (+),score=114.65 GHUV01019139.1:168-803(+)
MWLHFFMQTAAAKKGGLLSAMRQLADGHWVLAFSSGDKAAAAVNLVEQHAAHLRRLYGDALGPLCSGMQAQHVVLQQHEGQLQDQVPNGSAQEEQPQDQLEQQPPQQYPEGQPEGWPSQEQPVPRVEQEPLQQQTHPVHGHHGQQVLEALLPDMQDPERLEQQQTADPSGASDLHQQQEQQQYGQQTAESLPDPHGAAAVVAEQQAPAGPA